MSNLNNFTEEWRVIPDFPDYLVSNCGRVKSTFKEREITNTKTGKTYRRICGHGKLLKPSLSASRGYKSFLLSKDGKAYTKTAHRLVAECFIENKHGHPWVNHIDGNKHNNRVDNLEWCTPAYNHEHAIRTGLRPKGPHQKSHRLTESNVDAIRRMFIKGYSNQEIAEIFDVSNTSIWHIRNNRSWKSYLMLD